MTTDTQPEADQPELVTLLCLKEAAAPKRGQRAQGHVHYRLLTDAEHSQLYVQVCGNDGGGHFSMEVVPFAKVRAAISGLTPDMPFPARMFRNAFEGRSANNPGFLSCLLRNEALLTVVPEKAHQNLLSGDWPAWERDCLALPGEPIDIPTKLAAAVMSVALPADTAEPLPKPRRKDKRKAHTDEGEPHASAA